tara:strand:- start:5875 stop:6405 length:531 start_codon:yes stop_codon:yes gene_type:complete
MTVSERLAKHLDQSPVIPDSCWVAGTASIYGDVVLGERCSVWPSAVIRGDINSIRIGDETNIQDGAIVHLSDDFGVVLGKRVTIGHGAIIHACEIGDNCLIGMNATVLDGAKVGDGCIIGANALVTQGMVVPPNSMVLGTPGKIVKSLPPENQEYLSKWALKYVDVSRGFKDRGLQ